MLVGETQRRPHLHHLTPPWPPEPTSPTPSLTPTSPYSTILSSLRRTLVPADDSTGDFDYFRADDNDEFFMYEFKVRMCNRARAHDWTDCPFAHPGEKARRRDPRKFSYSGNSCTDFRKGNCKKGDACEFAHGVFESWLHPSKFRTQPCKDGPDCSRRVCFFAHSADQLRTVSALGHGPNLGSESLFDDGMVQVEVGELVEALRRSLQLKKANSLPRVGSSLLGSPPAQKPALGRTGLFSVAVTPTQPGGGYLDMWGSDKYKKVEEGVEKEEVVMERVESGRAVRAMMFEKLSKENCLHSSGFGSDPLDSSGSGPDFGWVSDLVT